MLNKIQVIFLICALPIVVLPFWIPPGAAAGYWRQSRAAGLTCAVLAAAALALAVPAVELVLAGIATAPSLGWRPAVLGFGVYQAAIAVWIAGWMVVFGVLGRVPWLETLAAMLCVLAGISLALLCLKLRYHPTTVAVVVNPLEQLMAWGGNPDLATGAGKFRQIIENIGVVIRTRTFVLDTSARPTIFLEWIVIAAAFLAWRAGHRRLVLQVAVVLLAGWGVDVLSATRGLKQQYFILSDPLVVIAAAILLTGYPQLQAHRRAYPVGAALMALHLAIGNAESVKHTFMTSVPYAICIEYPGYTKRIRYFPYCPQFSGRHSGT
jgi:hypothetical protein